MKAACPVWSGEKAEIISKPYLSLLFLHTKMHNVAGIGQSEAQKSSDMFGKCRYIDELTGGKGVTFASSTPLSRDKIQRLQILVSSRGFCILLLTFLVKTSSQFRDSVVLW